MPEEILALPSPDDSYIQLSGGDGERILRKRILPMNKSFIHPGDHKVKIFVDEVMASSLLKNFKNGVCEIVQVPIVNKENQHTEDPRDNAGRVIGLDFDSTGVYATIKASKYAEDFGKTILGASAFLHLNYIDTATGERVGPTLLHVAATNRPHVNGLGEFEEVIRASADISGEEQLIFMSEAESETSSEAPPEGAPPAEVEEPEAAPQESQTTSEETGNMTKEEWLEAGKEYGFDVEALQAEATRVAELSAELENTKNELQLSSEKVEEAGNLTEELLKLSNANQTMAADIEQLKLANANYAQRDAEHEVDGLIRVGKVLPAQRDVMVKLSMNDRETFEQLVPENPIVKLSEDGVTLHEQSNAEQYAADIERYKAKLADLRKPAKN